MGLVKLRGLRKKPAAVEIHNMKLLGKKGRVKARAKNRDVKKHKMAEHEVHPDGQSLNVDCEPGDYPKSFSVMIYC